jgi:hypothetical protein
VKHDTQREGEEQGEKLFHKCESYSLRNYGMSI